jgi:hypothetical protein
MRRLADSLAKVTRGARVVITLPASHCSWRGHDVFLGHRLRYRLPEVKALARFAGWGCRPSGPTDSQA